ncbi:lipoma-preferred partner-like protein [Plakobranchus ocellatus]|uniref:Lipoma-preferred partner-like protein n=1 Tax=Plakobranchus ocellatus TaxID=259542 RepID=A0AAV3ZP16_9GAST|nr:lipoma-preferred partner-like protein [Plakobranchus ocellatus]
MPDPGQEETVRIVAMDKSFHVDCYRCEDCKCQLSSEVEGRGCYPLDDHILCKNCNAKRIQALTTKMATDL